MRDQKIPVAEYPAYAKEFNSAEFEADAWARLAKEVGMKYVVITAKHHEGFAMFDSKFGDFNIVKNASFKRDERLAYSDEPARSGVSRNTAIKCGGQISEPWLPFDSGLWIPLPR